MENLPPINEMYTSMQQQKDYDVIRRYEDTRNASQIKLSPTKKGSFLDDAIKMNNSPGPANKSNIQLQWVKPNKQLVKYSNRKTYVDQIQNNSIKRNSPSPCQYKLQMKWPTIGNKVGHVSQKINFLDHSQYQSDQTPGPGSYLIATHIAKKTKQFHHVENKPLQPRQETSANMNTYDPIPVSYDTFKKFEKMTIKNNGTKAQNIPRKERQNLSPGPGQYQMINSWKGKEKKLAKGNLSYLQKICKGPALNVYYN